MRKLLLLELLAGSACPQSLLQSVSRIAPKRVNPYAGNERARRAGAKLFNENCAACHGAGAKGNGRHGTPPLATPFVRAADPGALFWILKNGSAAHRMPSFGHLPEQQRWQLITYLKGLRD